MNGEEYGGRIKKVMKGKGIEDMGRKLMKDSSETRARGHPERGKLLRDILIGKGEGKNEKKEKVKRKLGEGYGSFGMDISGVGIFDVGVSVVDTSGG